MLLIDYRTPIDLYTMYDPSTLAFNPPVPTPSSSINYRKLASDDLHSVELQAEIEEVDQIDFMKIWQDGIKGKKMAVKPVSKTSVATAQS